MRSYRIIYCLLCLLIITGISACGSNKKKELKPVELESFEEEIEIDRLWSRKIGWGMGEYFHQFVLAMDAQSVFAAAENGKVFKIDKVSGAKSWKVSLDTTLTSGVAVDEKNVYVGSIDGALIALDKENGQQVWSKKLTSEVISAPGVNAEHVVVQTANGQVFDLNVADGEQRWRFDSVMPALALRGNSRPQFFANYVVIGMANGKLAIIDIETGQLLWEPKVADPKGDTEIERIVDVDGSPMFIGDKLYAVSYQGQVVSYDLKTGHLLWAEEESSYRDLASGFGNIYVSSSDGVVTAYDEQTGTVKWSNDDFLRRRLTAPSVISSYVVVADYEGYVHLLSQIDGHIIARKRVNGSGVKAPILVDGTRFYVIANNGRLKAYELGEEIK